MSAIIMNLNLIYECEQLKQMLSKSGGLTDIQPPSKIQVGVRPVQPPPPLFGASERFY